MKWLRQQRKVEQLSTAVQANVGRMQLLRQQLINRVHSRVLHPSMLVWPFAAGCLVGSASPRFGTEQSEADDADDGSPAKVAKTDNTNFSQKFSNTASILRSLNSMAIILNLLLATRAEQKLDQVEQQLEH